MSATEKLYERDAFLAEFSAPVLDCVPAGGGWRAALAAPSALSLFWP